MGDNTHALTVGANNKSDTGSVHVPASVQREHGICIGTELEVTIENIEGLFSSVSFEGEQICGDSVSIPADIMRAADIEPGEQYPVSFEVVEEEASEAEEEADSLEDEEYAISDDEVGVDELMDDLEDDSETEQEAEVEDDEEEEEGLGHLFG